MTQIKVSSLILQNNILKIKLIRDRNLILEAYTLGRLNMLAERKKWLKPPKCGTYFGSEKINLQLLKTLKYKNN